MQMKQKKLEIFLQKTPEFEKPKPELEQYLTPATIAADILFLAYQQGDIKDKTILDLGCGTGIFSIGACLLGAKKVIGTDIDKNTIEIAKKFAKQNNLQIEYITKDVIKIKKIVDTVIMNPPFGAQKSNINADRKFLEKAFEQSKIIYSLHLSKTIPFIEKMIHSLKGEITLSKEYIFPIKSTQRFHKKKIENFNVKLIRIKT